MLSESLMMVTKMGFLVKPFDEAELLTLIAQSTAA